MACNSLEAGKNHIPNFIMSANQGFDFSTGSAGELGRTLDVLKTLTFMLFEDTVSLNRNDETENDDKDMAK